MLGGLVEYLPSRSKGSVDSIDVAGPYSRFEIGSLLILRKNCRKHFLAFLPFLEWVQDRWLALQEDLVLAVIVSLQQSYGCSLLCFDISPTLFSLWPLEADCTFGVRGSRCIVGSSLLGLAGEQANTKVGRFFGGCGNMPSLSGWKRSAREFISGPTRNGAASTTTTATTTAASTTTTDSQTEAKKRDKTPNRQSAGVLLKDLIRKAKHPLNNTTSSPSADTAPTSSIAEGASKAATKSVSATSDPSKLLGFSS